MRLTFIYPAIFHEDTDGLWAEFPNLPGCFTDGESMEELLKNASEAMAGYILTLLEDGKHLPKADSPLTIRAQKDSFVTLVSADVDLTKDTKSVKKTLSIPRWMDEQAKAKHINFSGTLQKALLQELQEA